MSILTGIDILGIQPFIFASSRLRDVYAASWLVENATGSEYLKTVGKDIVLQILQAAGGNVILEFDSLENARKWTARYTRGLYETAPGLEAVAAHRPLNGKSLAWGIKALQMDLARSKTERIPGSPQLGLSVTAPCAITGLPAVDAAHGKPVSALISALKEKRKTAAERWDKYLPVLSHLPEKQPVFPDEMDDLGRTMGETSLVGVVHVDGNGVGKAIQEWLDQCIKNETRDEDVRAQLNKWSEALRDLGEKVLKTLTERVGKAVKKDEKGFYISGLPHEKNFHIKDPENTKDQKNQICLPIRPILLGGDDLTFICDGRIALDLAAAALKEFEKGKIPHLEKDGGEKKITACAGVALIKSHAPFYRGYQLAEDLCRSAKKARIEMLKESGSDACWLDWHIGAVRPHETIQSLRERQYQHTGNNLTLRPYPLDAVVTRSIGWKQFETDILGPGKDENKGFRGAEHWSGSRSRVKRLAGLLPYGEDAVKQQMAAWKASSPEISFSGGLTGGGFTGNKTPLLDAIELMDLHIRLGGSSEEKGDERK